jgi:hypothetical protein
VLFASVSGHVDFASIRTHGQVVQQLFTAGRQQLTLPDTGAPPAAGLFAYIRIGLLHVLESPDHGCVLLAALLLVRRRRDVGAIIVALAGGYLLALTLASSGWVIPQVTSIEAFVGLLVALLGAVLALREGPYRRFAVLGWPSLLVLLAVASTFMHAPWAALVLLGGAFIAAGVMLSADRGAGDRMGWWVLIALFAFLDGAVMTAVLPPAQLPQRSLVQVALGFSAGAWCIETLLVAVIAAMFLVVRAPRIIWARALLDEVMATALSGVGTFWLVSRMWA